MPDEPENGNTLRYRVTQLEESNKRLADKLDAVHGLLIKTLVTLVVACVLLVITRFAELVN